MERQITMQGTYFCLAKISDLSMSLVLYKIDYISHIPSRQSPNFREPPLSSFRDLEHMVN